MQIFCHICTYFYCNLCNSQKFMDKKNRTLPKWFSHTVSLIIHMYLIFNVFNMNGIKGLQILFNIWYKKNAFVNILFGSFININYIITLYLETYTFPISGVYFSNFIPQNFWIISFWQRSDVDFKLSDFLKFSYVITLEYITYWRY